MSNIKRRTIIREIWWTLLSPINYLRGNWRIIWYIRQCRRYPKGFHEAMRPLYLTHLQLRRLPFLLRFLPHSIELKTLLLGNNRLSKLPKWLGTRTSIERIDLARNYFKAIPPVIFELKNLRDFYIDCNDLKEISPQIQFLSNLKYCSIGDCNLSKIPDFVSNWKTLSGLDISGNMKIKYIPPEMGELEDLYYFYFRNTSITTIPLSLRKIGLIRKTNETIRPYHGIPHDIKMPEKPLCGRHYFFYEHFSASQIFKNKQDDFRYAECFRFLFTIVPIEERSKYLTEFWDKRIEFLIEQGDDSIRFSGPNIDDLKIDWSLLKNPQIKVISFNFCITKIPDEIGRLNNLEYLLFDSYGIISLPKSLAKLTNLKSFSINYKHFPFKVEIPENYTAQEEIKYVLELQSSHLKE